MHKYLVRSELCPYIWAINEQQHAMKPLAFEIAKKIATDRRPQTLYICAALLKDAFKVEGYSDKIANEMALDGIRVIVSTMQRVAQ